MQQPPSDTFERVLTSEEKTGLRGETFRNRELVGMDFSGADLRGVTFERTMLLCCNLSHADLRGARFLLCELHAVVLANTVFGDNRFDGTTLVGVVGLDSVDRALIADAGGTFQPVNASSR
jgi:uncharacterized protein YjbI with pentapeptide repeats